MWPDRVSNLGPLTYESVALPTVLCGPAWSKEMKRTDEDYLSLLKTVMKCTTLTMLLLMISVIPIDLHYAL